MTHRFRHSPLSIILSLAFGLLALSTFRPFALHFGIFVICRPARSAARETHPGRADQSHRRSVRSVLRPQSNNRIERTKISNLKPNEINQHENISIPLGAFTAGLLKRKRAQSFDTKACAKFRLNPCCQTHKDNNVFEPVTPLIGT